MPPLDTIASQESTTLNKSTAAPTSASLLAPSNQSTEPQPGVARVSVENEKPRAVPQRKVILSSDFVCACIDNNQHNGHGRLNSTTRLAGFRVDVL